MTKWNPITLVKNLIRDVLLAVSGTWIGAPRDKPWTNRDGSG
jgi:hypothetical protein